MRTSKDDIRDWFKSGVRQEATHLIVICDTFDYTDYPVYILPGQDARKKFLTEMVKIWKKSWKFLI